MGGKSTVGQRPPNFERRRWEKEGGLGEKIRFRPRKHKGQGKKGTVTEADPEL